VPVEVIQGVRVCLAMLIITRSALPQVGQGTSPSEHFQYSRRYLAGEKYAYELKALTEGESTALAAVAEVEVRMDADVPYERIRWVSLKDGDTDESEAARRVPPTEFSLARRGSLQFTKPTDNPKMLGPVTDLYTFYFAVSPLAGIENVSQDGEEYVRPEPITGDWSDGKDYLVGQSHVEVRMRLVKAGPDRVTYQTAFVPTHGLRTETAWMSAPVCAGQPNNFQMIRRQGDGYVAVWGCEEFKVETEVGARTGRILSAHMDDRLTWKLMYCTDRELTKCSPLPDRKQHRLVDLSLREWEATGQHQGGK
jgi:hypothetical protein